MKAFILVSALFGTLVVAQCPKRTLNIDRRLLDAIKCVESSGGNEDAVGDNGASIGAYQIMKDYYNDAVEFNPSLSNGGKSYSDVAGPGSTAYAEEVVRSYMARYATRARLGRNPTWEDIARIHNGGPYGYEKGSTLVYWNSIQSALINKQGK